MEVGAVLFRTSLGSGGCSFREPREVRKVRHISTFMDNTTVCLILGWFINSEVLTCTLQRYPGVITKTDRQFIQMLRVFEGPS